MNLKKIASMFQFPSNGKAYTKLSIGIPDMFEVGFNSLQTGKHIQSEGNQNACASRNDRVSIPFKRESIYKV